MVYRVFLSRFTFCYLLLIINICSFLNNYVLVNSFQVHNIAPRRLVVGDVWNSLNIDGGELVDDSNNNKSVFVGATYRGKNMKQRKGDNRDYLPFSVCREGSSSEIGTYLLEPSTSCGDFLDLGNQGVFKVKKVAFLYKFQNGGFVVYKKKLEVFESSAPWRGDENVIASVEERNVLQ